MREYATPLKIEIPATGNLTDDVVTNAPRGTPTPWSSAATDRTALGRRHRGRVPRRGAGGRQGPGRGRHRGRRPGRPALQDPLRVDAARLRHLVRRRRHRADLRDLVGRADRAGSSTDSGARAVVAETAEHVARVDEVRAGPRRSCTTSGPSSDNAVDGADASSARTSRDDELEERRTTATPARPRHADLHLRDDRAPQGLHAHPRQLHVRARRRRRRAATSCSTPTDASHAAVPAAGPRLRPDHPGRLRQDAGSGWATAPTSRTWSPTSASSSRPSSWPCPRVFEKVFNTACQRAPPTAGARSSTAPPTSPSPGRAAMDKGRPLLPARAARALRPPGLRQAARRPRRPLRVRRLRRRAAGRPARPLLPRHRPDRARGLRPDRDDRGADRQPPRRPQDRHGRSAAARHRRCGSPTTASCCSRAARSSPATGTTTRRPREAVDARRLVPHRRRRRGRRRGLRPDHRAQEGDPRDRRRQERRPGRARGPAPRAPRWSTSASSSATASRSSAPWSPSTRETVPAWAEQHGKTGEPRRPRRRPRPARRDRVGRRGRQQGGLARPSRSASSRSCPTTGPRRAGS